MTQPDTEQPTPETVVLPDAAREDMLEAAGMTTGHRWEERYVDAVDAPEDED